jgi:hypothetical protein
MKPIPFLALLTLSLGFNGAGRADQMVAANDRVQIEVKVDANNDHKDLPKTNAETVIQHKTLDIILTGKARSNEARVIKWTVYGKNLKNNNVKALGTGEIKLSFDEHGAAKVQSKEVTCTYTPEHAVVENANRVKNLNRNNNVNRTTKRVEAEGEKYLGYSVKVLDGTRVVGEASDPVGVEEKN